MSAIVNVDDVSFEKYLHANKALIVDFWAPSCAPCHLMEPGLESIALEYRNQLTILKVNVNESPKVSSRYLIRTLPTLLFIKEGQVKTQLIGAVNPKQIERVLHEVL